MRRSQSIGLCFCRNYATLPAKVDTLSQRGARTIPDGNKVSIGALNFLIEKNAGARGGDRGRGGPRSDHYRTPSTGMVSDRRSSGPSLSDRLGRNRSNVPTVGGVATLPRETFARGPIGRSADSPGLMTPVRRDNRPVDGQFDDAPEQFRPSLSHSQSQSPRPSRLSAQSPSSTTSSGTRNSDQGRSQTRQAPFQRPGPRSSEFQAPSFPIPTTTGKSTLSERPTSSPLRLNTSPDRLGLGFGRLANEFIRDIPRSLSAAATAVNTHSTRNGTSGSGGGGGGGGGGGSVEAQRLRRSYSDRLAERPSPPPFTRSPPYGGPRPGFPQTRFATPPRQGGPRSRTGTPSRRDSFSRGSGSGLGGGSGKISMKQAARDKKAEQLKEARDRRALSRPVAQDYEFTELSADSMSFLQIENRGEGNRGEGHGGGRGGGGREKREEIYQATRALSESDFDSGRLVGQNPSIQLGKKKWVMNRIAMYDPSVASAVKELSV